MWIIIARIGAFLPSLFGFKPGLKAAKAIGIVTILIGLGLLFFIGKSLYDRSVIRDHEQKREIKAGKAREAAADTRVKDAIRNADNERELHEAIQSAPGGQLSPAAHALACKRLSNLGRVPPACRPQGSDGGQARPQ